MKCSLQKEVKRVNSTTLFEQIYNLENLFCAWKKAKNIYDTDSDFIFQIDELVEFEANLDKILKNISEQIKLGTYHLNPMTPLWLPKVSTIPESRQHFYFSVKDQVVWLAVINVIGPILDNAMPFWSFGNRLYMPIWKEDSSEQVCGKVKQVTRFGNYSSSSSKLYRNWSASWPLFRKAVSISVKAMAGYQKADYTDDECADIEAHANAPESFKIICWDNEYWKHQATEKEVYYASIDLKKFYPNVSHSKILNSKVKMLLGIENDDDSLKSLIESLLNFRVDSKMLSCMNPNEPLIGIDEKLGTFSGIPTGLFVAGFLANIAMLPIDGEIYNIQNESRRIGHFRFVDDHVLIAYSFDELCNWINQYEKIIKVYFPNMQINCDKIEPEPLKEYLDPSRTRSETVKSKAIIACKLDTRLPSPFTTLTLRKLSNINSSPFDLLDEAGKKDLLKDIEHILATDFPDEEIRKDTRVSWAASIMIRLVPSIELRIQDLYDKKNAMELALDPEKNEDKEYGDPKEKAKEYKNCKMQIDCDMKKTYSHIFSLLNKALMDNLAKPKLWKKCVTYCRTTGYHGIPTLLKALEDPSLTQSGKEYLFGTLISAIIKNVVYSIDIQKSNYFTSKEKNCASIFVESISEMLEEIIDSEKKYYHTEYASRLLNQLRIALSLYCLECEGKKAELVIDHATICFLWTYMPIYIRHSNHCEAPEIISLLSKNMASHVDDLVYRKLLLMFPNKLSSKIRNELSHNLLSPQHIRRLQVNGKPYISLQEFFTSDQLQQSASYVIFDLHRSEWTTLMIMRQVLNEVEFGKPKSFSSLTSLSEEQSNFLNCAPCNFYIDQDILDCKTWDEIRDLLERYPITYKPVCLDYRFDSMFYNRAGIAMEKRQVYSCAVLLLTLLSKSMDFNPLIGRSSSFDRNYKLLLDKLDNIPVSSYTQAILIGAMSDKWFEFQNHVSLGIPQEGRTEEPQNSPLKIDTIDDFKKEIDGAIKTLESYQLFLQDQAPRQLIPISLENLTRVNNPYTKVSDFDE